MSYVKIKDLDGRFCEPRFLWKMASLPFKQEYRAQKALELVHTAVSISVDVFSVIPTTWGGLKYYITFIDDYTHFTVVYVLKEKSDVSYSSN